MPRDCKSLKAKGIAVLTVVISKDLLTPRPCHPEERAQRSEGPHDRVHPRCSRQGHPRQRRAPVIFWHAPHRCHPEERAERSEGPYVREHPRCSRQGPPKAVACSYDLLPPPHFC